MTNDEQVHVSIEVKAAEDFANRHVGGWNNYQCKVFGFEAGIAYERQRDKEIWVGEKCYTLSTLLDGTPFLYGPDGDGFELNADNMAKFFAENM